MSGRWGTAALAAAGLGLIVLIACAPQLLRRVELFAVERVQVEGTRYLAPHEALERSGIASSSSVFDDAGPWRDSLLAHPLIEDARIERRLPSTLVVTVTEVEPVALAPTPALRPVDRRGTVLPIEPAQASMDLPILDLEAGVDSAGRLEDPEAMELIHELERLRRLAPAFAALVSEIGKAADGAVRIMLREPAGAEVLLPHEAGVDRLGQLARTLEDLGTRDELMRARRIDVRYRDQVVVSLTP